MTSVRTRQRRFLLFRFLTIPFLLLLIFALALDGLTAYAEPPIGPVPTHEKSLSVPPVVAKVRPSVVTIPSFWLEGDHVVLALNVKPGGPAVVGSFQNCDIITTVNQHQSYNLGDSWHSLRPSGDQPTPQLTNRRKNAQSTISLQNPSAPKAVP